ncbi:MAG TPA: hypothetical protein PKI08_09885 [Aquaticitalea sp.]|nr:hypothetical protein [Aquaticitalea sp.]
MQKQIQPNQKHTPKNKFPTPVCKEKVKAFSKEKKYFAFTFPLHSQGLARITAKHFQRNKMFCFAVILASMKYRNRNTFNKKKKLD